MDGISESRLVEVHPELARRVQQLASMLNIPIRVTCGVRSWSDQEADWLKGRNGDGEVVDPAKVITNAKPGHSWHQMGLAADLVPMLPDGQPDWNVTHASWQELIAACPSCGLRSGSTFEHLKDNPHVQPAEITESPTPQDIQELTDGGITAYWELHPLQEAD